MLYYEAEVRARSYLPRPSCWSLAFSFAPVSAVQIAIAHRFGDVVLLDLRCAFQVGYGAGHLEDTAVGAGREVQSLHSGVEEAGGRGIQGAVFPYVLSLRYL